MRWSVVSGRVSFALGVALAMSLFSSTALAYCRAKTCSLGKTDLESDQECAHRDGCISEGASLHWPSPCLTYAVQVDGSPASGLDADQVAELAEQAFSLWKSAECEWGHPDFEAHFQGFVTCDQQETVCARTSGNVSVVMFHDDAWPYGASDLGITSPTASTESGEMHDADIEINSQTIASSSLFELFPVLAHEVGHYLGLAHSNVDGALMSVSYSSIGTSGDLLTADDAAGICAIYPQTFLPRSCGARAPAYDTCKNPDSLESCALKTVKHDSGGCSMAPDAPASPEEPLFALGISLGAAWLVRRRLAAERRRMPSIRLSPLAARDERVLRFVRLPWPKTSRTS